MNQTQSSTYNPTFMEKLLGKWYKWWFLIYYSIRAETTYFASNMLHFLGQSVVILSAILIWSMTPEAGQIISSLFLGLILFTFSSNTVYWVVGSDIKSGKITKNLIIPNSLAGFYFFSTIGYLAVLIIYYFVLIFLVFFLLGDKLEFSFNFTYLILSTGFVLMAFVIRFLIGFILGSITFWTVEYEGQINLYESLIPLFAGLIIPFSLLTESQFYGLLLFLPWSYIVHHPMQIYLGNYDTNQTLLVFAGGIIWCIVLYFLAKLVFKMGLKRNESVGL